MNGAAPPDPNRLAEDCSVDEGNQCSYAHFVRDDCVRFKTPELPQIAWIEMKILLVEPLAFFASGNRNLPTPRFNDLGPRQHGLDVAPGVAVAFASAVKDQKIE